MINELFHIREDWQAFHTTGGAPLYVGWGRWTISSKIKLMAKRTSVSAVHFILN